MVFARSGGVKRLARRAIIASVKRGLRMIPPASAEATLGVIAASTATGWRCHRADSVRAFDQRAAAPLSPADRPHRRVNFGSFERACRKVHVADRSLVQMARKSDDWPVRASSSPPPVHRWPIRTAASVHVWPVVGRGPLRPKGLRRRRPSAAPNAALSAGAFRTSRRASWDGWLGQATRTGMALNFLVFRHDAMVEPAMNCSLPVLLYR